jgi:hypothetical protein
LVGEWVGESVDRLVDESVGVSADQMDSQMVDAMAVPWVALSGPLAAMSAAK